MNSKKVLIVTHHYLNGNGGGVFASRAYINALAEIYSDVTLLYPVKEGHPIEHINKKVKAIPVKYDVPKITKLWHVLIGQSHRYLDVFEKTLSKDNYDTVVFDTSNVTWKLIDIAHKHHAKVITIHHNFQMEYDRDNSNVLLRPIILHWTKCRERESVLKSDLNLTITKQDKELLQTFYDRESKSRIEVLGCFEYEESTYRIINEDYSSKSNSNFVITGNLSAVQTEKSLLPWLNDYYPILKELVPDATLTIAGKNPSAHIISLCRVLGITIIPSPESITPIMEKADYYICPTCLGGGLKLRVMDGLRHGLPVLSHSVSARGYDVFKDNGVLFSYEDKASFAEAIKEITEIKKTEEGIANLYSNEFAFEVGVARLENILRNL